MKRIKRSTKPTRSSDVPATAGMLYEMEERLNSRMDSVKHELKSDFAGLKSEFSGLKSEFSGLKSEFSSLKSEMHRVALLVEEQNARNKYVMDGYAQIYDMIKELGS